MNKFILVAVIDIILWLCLILVTLYMSDMNLDSWTRLGLFLISIIHIIVLVIDIIFYIVIKRKLLLARNILCIICISCTVYNVLLLLLEGSVQIDTAVIGVVSFLVFCILQYFCVRFDGIKKD